MTRRAVITMALLGMCGVAGLAVACTDGNLSPGKATRVVAGRSAFSRVPGRAPVTPAEFDQRNPMHWAGVAHNRGVDFVRSQLRAHRLHVRDMCREVPVLLARDEARPVGHRTLPAAELVNYARRHLASEDICPFTTASTNVTSATAGGMIRPASMIDSRIMLDDEAIGDSLLDGISLVTGNAADASSLAPQLDSITSLADNLDSISRSVVYGTAAVAMSSMEYWEANLPSVTYEVDRDYCDTEAPDPNAGPCMEIPYSLVAPVALPAMVQSVDWGILGKIAKADIKVIVAGRIAGWLLKAISWEAVLVAADADSTVTACGILYDEIRSKF